MTDEIKAVTETAKAVQEVAKTGGKVIDAASDAGRFFAGVMGDLVVDGFGLVSDRLKFYRLERAVLLAEKTQERLKEKGITNFRVVAPKIALTLIESATIEDNDDLHSLWANLLAAAMDPNGPDVRRSYLGILSNMNPCDVLCLKFLYDITNSTDSSFQWRRGGGDSFVFKVPEIAGELNLTPKECELALFNLDRLGTLMMSVGFIDFEVSQECATDNVSLRLTPLGKAFVEAAVADHVRQPESLARQPGQTRGRDRNELLGRELPNRRRAPKAEVRRR